MQLEEDGAVSPLSNISWELLPVEQHEVMAVAKTTPGASDRMNQPNGGSDGPENVEDFKPLKPLIVRDQTCTGPYKLDDG